MDTELIEVSFIHFECTKCKKSHTTEVESIEDDDPTDAWPLGWLYFKTAVVSNVVGEEDDLELFLCVDCKAPLEALLSELSYDAARFLDQKNNPHMVKVSDPVRAVKRIDINDLLQPKGKSN